MASNRFLGTAELQGIPSELLQNLSETGETFFITEEGKAKAVLMDINRYNALMDLVEEAENPPAHDEVEDTRKHASVRSILSQSTCTMPIPQKK
jgi:PHD/YefM family antitoxin component YafN of YafNO toxin-antitoxin module